MLFDAWYDILRVLVLGTLAYSALVIILRTSGKRTLAKMNAFDFVVTVALGSTLATILLSSEVALAEGVAALGVLVLLQFVVAWLNIRSSWMRRLVKAEPRMLFYRGEMLHDALRRERVTEAEVFSALRQQGLQSLEQVEAVVLETAGDFSIIRRSTVEAVDALERVSRA